MKKTCIFLFLSLFSCFGFKIRTKALNTIETSYNSMMLDFTINNDIITLENDIIIIFNDNYNHDNYYYLVSMDGKNCVQYDVNSFNYLVDKSLLNDFDQYFKIEISLYINEVFISYASINIYYYFNDDIYYLSDLSYENSYVKYLNNLNNGTKNKSLENLIFENMYGFSEESDNTFNINNRDINSLVSGNIKWIDVLGNYHNCANIYIGFYTFDDYFLGSTYTNENGDFLYNVNYKTNVLKCIIKSKTNNFDCYFYLQENIFYLYNVDFYIQYNNLTNSYTSNFVIDDSVSNYSMFEVIQALDIAVKYINTLRNDFLCDFSVYYGYSYTAYNQHSNIIYISLQDVHDWDIILHEFSHYVENYYSLTSSIGGDHYINYNYYDYSYYNALINAINENQTLSNDEIYDNIFCSEYLVWSEGFATFLSIMIQYKCNLSSMNIPYLGDLFFDDTDDYSFRIDVLDASVYYTNNINETFYTEIRYGYQNELDITAALMHIYGFDNNEYDEISLSNNQFISCLNYVTTFEGFMINVNSCLNNITKSAILGKMLSYFGFTINNLDINRNTKTISFEPNDSMYFKNNDFIIKFFKNSQVIETYQTNSTSYTLSDEDWLRLTNQDNVYMTILCAYEFSNANLNINDVPKIGYYYSSLIPFSNFVNNGLNNIPTNNENLRPYSHIYLNFDNTISDFYEIELINQNVNNATIKIYDSDHSELIYSFYNGEIQQLIFNMNGIMYLPKGNYIIDICSSFDEPILGLTYLTIYQYYNNINYNILDSEITQNKTLNICTNFNSGGINIYSIEIPIPQKTNIIVNYNNINNCNVDIVIYSITNNVLFELHSSQQNITINEYLNLQKDKYYIYIKDNGEGIFSIQFNRIVDSLFNFYSGITFDNNYLNSGTLIQMYESNNSNKSYNGNYFIDGFSRNLTLSNINDNINDYFVFVNNVNFEFINNKILYFYDIDQTQNCTIFLFNKNDYSKFYIKNIIISPLNNEFINYNNFQLTVNDEISVGFLYSSLIDFYDKYTWSSNNDYYAEISNNGIIKAKMSGGAIITGIFNKNSNVKIIINLQISDERSLK